MPVKFEKSDNILEYAEEWSLVLTLIFHKTHDAGIDHIIDKHNVAVQKFQPKSRQRLKLKDRCFGRIDTCVRASVYKKNHQQRSDWRRFPQSLKCDLGRERLRNYQLVTLSNLAFKAEISATRRLTNFRSLKWESWRYFQIDF